jgi:pimeloyl-ACP methyl ester carboxylesterase
MFSPPVLNPTRISDQYCEQNYAGINRQRFALAGCATRTIGSREMFFYNAQLGIAEGKTSVLLAVRTLAGRGLACRERIDRSGAALLEILVGLRFLLFLVTAHLTLGHDDLLGARLERFGTTLRIANPPAFVCRRQANREAIDVFAGKSSRGGGDTAKALASIKAKTLIFTGTKDLLNPEFEPREAGKNIVNVKMMTINPGTVTGHASAGGAGAADVEFLNRETAAFLDAVTEGGKKVN